MSDLVAIGPPTLQACIADRIAHAAASVLYTISLYKVIAPNQLTYAFTLYLFTILVNSPLRAIVRTVQILTSFSARTRVHGPIVAAPTRLQLLARADPAKSVGAGDQ
jgi:hypothetical protein